MTILFAMPSSESKFLKLRISFVTVVELIWSLPENIKFIWGFVSAHLLSPHQYSYFEKWISFVGLKTRTRTENEEIGLIILSIRTIYMYLRINLSRNYKDWKFRVSLDSSLQQNADMKFSLSKFYKHFSSFKKWGK